jgi:hypothetical protein
MQSLSIPQPLNRWNYDSIRPGNVGSVGDCLVAVELKTSSPDMTPRYGNLKDLSALGSEVGTVANTKGGFWGMHRDFKTNIGWVYQDLVSNTTKEPLVGSTPQYMHRNRIATAYEAKRTGFGFLPLPKGYGPQGEMVRGGHTPRVTNVEGLGEEMIQHAYNALGKAIVPGRVSFSGKAGVKKAKLKK